MLNPRHTLTTFQKKMADKDYDNHKKRLAEINKPKKNISEEKDIVMRSTFVDLHSKHVQFQTTEKVSSLDKTNKVLLDKLVKISRNQKPALFKSTHWTGHPGTLNTTYRKKELERIALENESMAKRLISQHSSVDHKKLKLDFLRHKEFSKNAQKNTYSSPKLSAKLPPLQSPKQEESPKDLRIKNKIKQRISESLSPAASKSQTLDKTQEAQPAIRVVDSIPANPNRESNLSIQPQQAQERKEAPTSRSSQPQEAVEASARQSDSRRESQVNENSQQEKQEVEEQGKEISRKTSTKTVGEGENQVQSDKVEEKAVEVKEKEKEKEEEGEKSEKSEKVEEKQEVVNEAQEVKEKEEEGENKEVENKDKQENNNA